MSKDAVSDWSTTASLNGDIGGISIAEGSFALNTVDNAFREIMAQVAGRMSTAAVSITEPKYGAVAGQDCTTAITTAHNDMVARGGGVVHVPERTSEYLMDAMDWDPRVSLIGDGPALSKIKLNATQSQSMFLVQARSNGNLQFDNPKPYFEGLTLDGNKSNQTDDAAHHDLALIEFEVQTDDDVTPYSSSLKYRSGAIVNCELIRSGGRGVLVLAGMNQLHMTRSRCHANRDDGLLINSASDCVIIGGDFGANGDSGGGQSGGHSVHFQGNGTPIIVNANIFHSSDRENGKRAIFSSNAKGPLISGNTITDIIEVKQGAGEEVNALIVGNVIKPSANALAGTDKAGMIICDGTDMVVITGNLFYPETTDKFDNIVQSVNSGKALFHYQGLSAAHADCPATAVVNDEDNIMTTAHYNDTGDYAVSKTLSVGRINAASTGDFSVNPGTSGASIPGNADETVIEGNGTNVGLSVLAGDQGHAHLYMGNEDNNNLFRLRTYGDNTDSSNFRKAELKSRGEILLSGYEHSTTRTAGLEADGAWGSRIFQMTPLTGSGMSGLTHAQGKVAYWDGSGSDPGTPSGNGEGIYVSDGTNWVYVGG